MKYYVILVIMTILGALASFFLKKASFFSNIKLLMLNINLYIGCLFYLISAILNIYILRYLPYSIVLPLTSLTYVWTLFISHYFLDEIINKKKIIGVIMIPLGALLIGIN